MLQSLRHPRVVALALALGAACAKPAALPVAHAAKASDCAGTPPICGRSVATGQPVTLDGSGEDPGGKTLHYAWTFQNVPPGSHAALALPETPNPILTPDVPGAYDVQLIVRNDFYASDPVAVKITASDCGANVPTVSVLAALPASPGVNVPVQLSATVDDKDNDAACQAGTGADAGVPLGKLQVLTYAWSLIAQPPGSRAHLSDPAAHAPHFVPDASGQYLAQLVVTDDTGRSSLPQQLPVSVVACGNALPLIGAFSNVPSTPGIGVATQLSALVTDADSDAPCSIPQTFTYQWSPVSLPESSHSTLNNPAVSTPSFTPDQPGVYTFRLVVTNQSHHVSLAKDFTVGVTGCGGAIPVPTVAFSPAAAGVGTPVQIKATVSDANDSCLTVPETFTYRWNIRTQPSMSFAALNDPTASNPSFTPDQPGDYLFELAVTDSSGNDSQPVSLRIHVASCGRNAPSIDTLAASPAQPNAGQLVVLTPATSDADSACPGFDPTLTYAWSLGARPKGSASFIRDPLAATASFVPDLPGIYQSALVVTDATGLSSAVRLLTLSTTSCGLAPPGIVPASAGADNLLPDPGSPIQLFAVADDADNQPPCNFTQSVSLRWAVTARPLHSTAALSDPNSARPSFTPDLPGSYQFSVAATDSTGLKSAPAWVNVTASRCGQGAISVAATPAFIGVAPDDAVQLSATPSATDTSCGLSETFTYVWQIASAPGGSNAVLSNPSSPSPLFTPDLAGDYSLSVTAADQRGHVSPAAFVHVAVSSCASLGPAVDFLTATAATLGNPVTVSVNAATDRNCVATGALVYQWRLAARPPTSAAVIADPTAPGAVFTPDVAGTYQLSLVVTDNLGLSSRAVFQSVSVAPCTSSTITWLAKPIAAVATEPDTSAATVGCGAADTKCVANVGSQVALSANFTDTNPACTNVSVAPIAYRWALISRPAGSNAKLGASTSATPSLIPDVAGGAWQIALQVIDALGTVASAPPLTITTSSCGRNVPAVGITQSSPQAVSTWSPQTLSVAGGTATDPDGDSTVCPARFAPSGFTYAWSIASTPLGGRAQLSTGSGTQTSFEAFATGTYGVQLVATAASGVSSPPATLVFNVSSCGSHPPSVVSVTVKSGASTITRPAVGQPVSLTANLFAPDASCGDTIASIAWSLVSTPGGSAVLASAASSSPTFSFTPDVFGTYSFTVAATDTNGLVSAPFPVSVTTASCGPVLNAAIVSSNSTPVLGETVALSVPKTGGKPDLTDACVAAATYSYAWTVLSRPPTSQTMLGAVAGASTSLVTDVSGSYLVQLVVTDSAGLTSAPAQTLLQAGSCGTLAPVLNNVGATGSPVAAAPAIPNIGDVVTLTLPSVTDSNSACASTQPYSYRWQLATLPAASRAALSASTDAAPTFVPDVPGTYQVSVAVADAVGNLSAPAFFTLQTSSCGANLPSVSIAPAGSLSVNALTPLALLATPSDADNACPARFAVGFTYRWSLSTIPAGGAAVLTTSSAASTSFQASVPGAYAVQVVAIATNGFASAPASAPITVGACGSSTPQIVAVRTKVLGNITSRPPVGAAVTLTASGFDADNLGGGVCGAGLGQTLSYAWTVAGLPSGSGVSIPAAQNGSPVLGFTADLAGTYLFDVVVSDGSGLRSPPYRVTVPTGSCGPNLSGVLASTTAPQIGQAVALSTLPASVTSSCVSGGAIAFSWSVVARPPGSNAQFAAPSAQSQSFTPDAAGNYQLQVVATDSGGFSTAASATLSAGGCTSAPTFASVTASATEAGSPSATAFRDDAVTLSVNGVQPGCSGLSSGPFSYNWSLVSLPPSSHARLLASTDASPTFLADVAGGSWQAMVVVTDQFGNASTPGFVAVTAATCGARAPASAVQLAPSATPKTFQPVTLTATTPSDPNAGCPSRFLVTGYSYQWSVVSQPPAGRGSSLVRSGQNATFTALSPGAFQLQLVSVGSDGVASAPLPIAITAQQCGFQAPVASLFTATQALSGLAAPATLDVNLPVVLGATLTDPDVACGGALAGPIGEAWSFLSTPAGSAALLSNASSAAPGFTPDLGGTYTLQLISTDATGLSTTQTFPVAVSVTCGTHAPVARAGADPVALPAFAATQPVPGGATLTSTSTAGHANPLDLRFPVSVQANVVDDDALCGLNQGIPTYAWSLAGPAGSTATLAGATTARPAFSPAVLGLYTLTLVLTDSTGLSSSQTFSVTASCGGAPPQALDATGLPAFSATQTLTNLVTKNGASTLTVPSFPIVTSTLGSAAPAANTNVPFFPGRPIGLAAHVVDADASCGGGYPETIAYSWSLNSAPAGSRAAMTNPSAAAPSLTPDLPGTYGVQLTLTDSTGLSSTQQFAPALITVGHCGLQGPSASIGLTTPAFLAAPQSSATIAAGARVTLDGSSSTDADNVPLDIGPTPATGCGLNLPLSYSWAFQSFPSSAGAVALTNADFSNPSFTPLAAGLYDLRLFVSDGVNSNFADVNITATLPSAATSTVSPAPANPVVGPNPNGSVVTVTVKDALGNRLIGSNVTFASSGSANFFTPASGITDSNGSFVTRFTSTKAQAKSLVATAGPVPLTAVPVTFRPGPTDHLVFTTQPPPVSMPTTRNLVITPGPVVNGQDSYNNLSSFAGNVTIALAPAPAPGGAKLKGTLTRSAGVTFGDLTIDTVGDYSLRATASTPNPTVDSTILRIQTQPPGQPTSVMTTFVPGTLKQISLTWNAPLIPGGSMLDPNVIQYEVYRCNSLPACASATLVTTVVLPAGECNTNDPSTLCFTDTTLAADGTNYGYYVVADSGGGQVSGHSSPVATGFTNPAAVLALKIDSTMTTQTQLALTWTNPASPFDLIDISSSQDGTNYNLIKAGLANTATGYKDTGLNPGDTWFYLVTTRLLAGNITDSAPVTGQTLLAQVQNLVGGSSKEYQLDLSWDPANGATNYLLSRGTSSGLYTDSIATGNVTSYSDLTVLPGVAYFYAIKALDSAGAGPNSTELAVSTLPTRWQPGGVGLSGAYVNQLILNPSGTTLFAATGLDPLHAAGVFRSTDTAATWSSRSNGLPNGAVITSIAAAWAKSEVFAGTATAGVYASFDNGVSWRVFNAGLGANLTVSALIYDAATDTLTVGTSAGAILQMKPVNTTGSWTVTDTGGLTQAVQFFALGPADQLYAQAAGGSAAGGGLLALSGTSWAGLNGGFGTTPDCSITAPGARALAVTASGNIYWGSANCGAQFSTNSGFTFTMAGDAQPAITALAATTIAAKDDVWIGTATGTRYLQGGSLTFTTAGALAAPTTLVDDPATASHLFGGNLDGTGLQRTLTARTGTTMAVANSGITNLSVTSIARDKSNGDLYAVGPQFKVARSTDKGANFALNTGSCGAAPAGLIVDPTTTGGSTVYVACSGTGVLATTNQGATWTTLVGAGLPTTPAFAPVMAVQTTAGATKHDLYVVTTPTAIWMSGPTGVGATFTTVTTIGLTAMPASVSIIALTIDSSDNLFASLAGGQTYRLPASGTAWAAAATGRQPNNVGAFFIDTHPAIDQVLAAGTGASGGSISSTAANIPSLWLLYGSGAPLLPTDVTAFGGRVTSSSPELFAGTSLTTPAGQSYVNLFRNNGGASAGWPVANDGVTGGNATAVVPIDSAGNVVAGTSGAGIFISASSGQ